MGQAFEEKMKVVLNLIRTNNTADEVLKITQAALNLAQARNTFALTEESKSLEQENQDTTKQKKQGASAS